MILPRRRTLRQRFDRFLAESAYFFWGVWTIRWPISALLLLWVVGASLFHVFGAPPGGSPPGWSESFYIVFNLFFLEHVEELAAHPVGQALEYLLPVIGIFLVADGLIKLGLTVFSKDSNPEKWMKTLASTSKDHVILCGLGNVGFRVLEELVSLGERVFVIEQSEDGEFVGRAKELGAEVFIGDARSENILRTLNIERARAVIVATDNDLANLEIAMDVRDLRSDIPIVLRLFDQRLAKKVQKTLGFQVSFSTSQLAAPLFAAAALDPSVVGAHRIGGAAQVMLQLEIRPGVALDGITVSEVLGNHQLTVLAVRKKGEEWRAPPSLVTRLSANDEVQVMVKSDEVARVHALNRSK